MIVAILLVVAALVIGGVAVAGIVGKLPRNRWAGIRTPASMRNDEAFVVANRVAAPSVLAAALILLVGAAASLMFSGLTASIAVILCAVAAGVMAIIGGAIGARAAAALPEPAAVGGCGHACTSCSLKDACQPS